MIIKNNIIPFIIAVILFGSCCVAWYLFHPSSPHHERYSFVVSYDAIGTLSPGNRVQVRGITKGEIMKVELTDDAVFVTARVLADTKIPVNSEYRLINAGLMGEREMCVLTGDAKEYISDGDTVIGHYDEGTSGVFKSLDTSLTSLSQIKDALLALRDSVTVGSTGQSADRVIQKGKKLMKVSISTVEEWKSGANGILDNCSGILEQAKKSLANVKEQADGTEARVKELVDRIDALLEHLKSSKLELDALVNKLDQDDNSIKGLLDEDGVFAKKLDRLSIDIDALISDIKKSGVKLNVDIF